MSKEVSVQIKTNGTTPTQEGEWVIARDEGLWLVGRLALFQDGELGNEHQVLSPVFELTVQVQPQVDPRTGQTSGMMVNDHLQPLLLMGFLSTKWKLSPKANTWRVKEIGAAREKSIRMNITRAEEIVRSMRAQEAGITLAREMPKPRLV